MEEKDIQSFRRLNLSALAQNGHKVLQPWRHAQLMNVGLVMVGRRWIPPSLPPSNVDAKAELKLPVPSLRFSLTRKGLKSQNVTFFFFFLNDKRRNFIR